MIAVRDSSFQVETYAGLLARIIIVPLFSYFCSYCPLLFLWSFPRPAPSHSISQLYLYHAHNSVSSSILLLSFVTYKHSGLCLRLGLDTFPLSFRSAPSKNHLTYYYSPMHLSSPSCMPCRSSLSFSFASMLLSLLQSVVSNSSRLTSCSSPHKPSCSSFLRLYLVVVVVIACKDGLFCT